MAIAIPATSYAEWTLDGAVTTLYVSSDETIYVTTSAPATNPANCSKDWYYKLTKNINSSYDHIAALLMSAQTANRAVKIFIKDTECNANYPIIEYIKMETPAP